MTKRFCDKCDGEIPSGAVYYVEEVRAIGVIMPPVFEDELKAMIVSKRELCASCSPAQYRRAS